MKLFERLKEWIRTHDRDVMRRRLDDPRWIEIDQKLREESFKKGILSGIAFMSVAGYQSYTCQHKNIRGSRSDLPIAGEWEVIVRRVDVNAPLDRTTDDAPKQTGD